MPTQQQRRANKFPRCQNSVEDIKRAHANIFEDARACARVDQLTRENEAMTLGDAIVQAEKELFERAKPFKGKGHKLGTSSGNPLKLNSMD